MGASTIYDVKVKYSMDDKASSGMKSLASHTDKAASSAMTLHGALAAVGGIAALHFGKELLVDFNSEMDKLKIGMTTVMQMNMHMPFEKASAAADKLFFTFQDMAKKSPLMTKDFMEMASAIAPAVSMAGGGVGKLQKMTAGALTAGLAFNVRPDQMAMDIQEMLAGNVRLTSRTARQLLASKGLDHKEFNAKSGVERAGITESILGDPALIKASERAAHTFAGEVSTVKDNLQIAFGEVGLPLMHAMTEEVQRWNQWIEKHPKLIKEWVTSFAATIKNGFDFLKDVASWFVEHKDLLEGLAKTFIAFKGAQMAGNVFNRFTTGIGGLADSVKNAIAKLKGGEGIGSTFGGFTGIASGIVTKVLPALGLFSGALEIATNLLNTHAEEEKHQRETALSLNEATGEIPTLQARRKELDTMLSHNIPSELALRAGTEKEGIEKKLFSPETLGIALRKIGEVSEANGGMSFRNATMADMMNSNLIAHLPETWDSKNIADNTRIMTQVDATLKQFQNMPLEIREEAMRYANPEQFGMPTPAESKAPDEKWKGLTDANVNVTIQKVEVASEDPDRFVFGLVQIADQSIKHATQSQHSVSGGF